MSLMPSWTAKQVANHLVATIANYEREHGKAPTRIVLDAEHECILKMLPYDSGLSHFDLENDRFTFCGVEIVRAKPGDTIPLRLE